MNGVMGGLERQILEISKMLSQKNYEVHIITFDQESFKPFFDDIITEITDCN